MNSLFPRRTFLLSALALGLSGFAAKSQEPETQNTPPSIPKILGISHVAVKASDVEKSVAFYRDFLGFAEQGRLNVLNQEALLLVYMKVSENQWIEIFDAAQTKPERDRIYQIALHVDDAEALRAHLANSEFSATVPSRTPVGQMGNPHFTVRGPHGYIFEIVQYIPDGVTLRDKGKFLPDTRISDHIAHAGVIIDNLEEADRFYQNTLGFRESWKGSSNNNTISWRHMLIQESTDFVEWMLDPNAAPHFCLEVENIETAKAKLEASPYFATYQATGNALEIRTGINRKRQLNVYDPEGVRVELMEKHTVDGQPAPSSGLPYPEHLRR